jgi:hypothetical protein
VDGVERAQQRRTNAPGETNDISRNQSFGYTGQRTFDSVVNLVFVVRAAVEPGPQRPTDLDPSQ